MAGETTALDVPTALSQVRNIPVFPGPALHVYEMLATYSATNQLELNDVMEVSYLPPGIKIWMVGYLPTDMDTGTALVQKITVGSTDVATTLNGGQTGTAALVQLATPYVTTAQEKVTITNTTAAGTGATGSVKLRFYFTAP